MSTPVHSVAVPDVGTFVFKKRTLVLQLEIEGNAERLTKGPVQSDSLHRFAMAVAALEVLAVEVPDGWDLADVDPLDDEAFGAVLKVFGALRAAEETFRTASKAKRPKLGSGA